MQNKSRLEGRSGLLMTIFALVAVTTLAVLPTQLQWEVNSQEKGLNTGQGKGLIERTVSHDDELPNFDIRETKTDESTEAFAKYRESLRKTASSIADVRDGFARGEADLRQRVPSLKIEYNNDIRIPEVIGPDVAQGRNFLTPQSGDGRANILRNFVKENDSLIGVTRDQAEQLKVRSDYTNPDGNLSYVQLDQLINGIPVFRGEVKAGFTKDNEIVRVINNLAPGLDYDQLSGDFRNPLNAVKAATRHINVDEGTLDLTRDASASDDLKVAFGKGDWATTAEKMYFPTEPGVAVPAWRVLIWQPVNAYYVIVDAKDGTMLWRKNITEDQTQAATYQIYANSNAMINVADSPAPLTPGPIDPGLGTQGALISRSSISRIGNEAPYTFNNNGWITDGTNVTDGNYNEAGIDRVAPNGVDATQPGDTACPGAGCRTFTSTWNPPPGSPAPGDDPLTAQAQRGAVIQMFYAMNLYQSEMYALGFTEQAFNFQTDNFGRGGVGADRVSSEGQDSSGTNNANFSTPADGGRGRMQMFLWTGPTPDYDGTTDIDVVIHEVTHGLSNRLHGNSSGLSTNMARGMGEGWSDFYGHSMLSEPTDPANGIYTTGGYATYLAAAGFTGNYYYGIRRYPKARLSFTGGPNNLPHNAYRFSDINVGCAARFTNATFAFARGPFGAAQCDAVHNIGEVWSSALWEARDRLITRLGAAAGNRRMLQFVTDGMKLAPLAPTLLTERDAIIAAAQASSAAPEAAADVADMWSGFAARGMGFDASIQNIAPAAVTDGFGLPNAVIVNPFVVSDSTGDGDGFPEPGENLLLTVNVTNNTGATVNNVSVAVAGGGTVNYGSIANGATVANQIPYTVPAGAACGSIHQVSMVLSSSVATNPAVTREFRLGAPVGGAPLEFTGGAIANPGTGTVGVAAPYPSTINVAGVSGQRVISLELTNLNTTFPGDMDWLLVGPGGQKFIFMSDAVSAFATQTNAVVVIRDGAAAVMPPTAVTNLNGEWRPTNHGANDPFAAPAPAAPYENAAPGGTATFASVFGTDGAAMNGAWSLYGVDDVTGDIATVTGWKLTFGSDAYECSLGTPTPTPTPGPPTPTPTPAPPTPTPTPTPTPVPPTPTPTPGPSTFIYDNGGLEPVAAAKNGTASPAGGFWSEVQNDSPITAGSSAGASCSLTATLFRCADDFTVPAGQTWTVDQIAVFVYQTGFAGATSPVTSGNLRIWSGVPGDVGSTVIFGDTTTNRLASSTFNNNYRIFNTVVGAGAAPPSVPGTTRRIWDTRLTVSPAQVLAPGTYWIDWQTGIAGNAAHFAPNETVLNQRTQPGWNSRQFNGTTWAALTDPGITPTGNPAPPVVALDFPFKVGGSISGGGTPTPTPTPAPPTPTPTPAPPTPTPTPAPPTPTPTPSTAFFGSGALETTDPTFVNPNGSTVGTGRHYYDVVQFTANTTGAHTIEISSRNTTGTPSNALDTFLRLYQTSFNPATPAANSVLFNDDFTGTLTVLPGPFTGAGVTATATGFSGNQPSSRTTVANLTAGTTYFMVVTSFRATDFVGTATTAQPRGAYWYGINPGVTPVTPNDARADFDGDGRTDLSVFRGTEGNWYLQRSTAGFQVLNWGINSDTLVPGDYDGDGIDDVAVFRPDANPVNPDFYMLNSNGFVFTGVSWGVPGDVPANADFDGDGEYDIAVYRASEGNWYVLLSSNGGNVIINNPGTTPVPGDYDGDGEADGIIYTNGTWTGALSGGGNANIALGQAGDIPVPGDYDGDGSDDQAVYRPSEGNWYARLSSNSQVIVIPFGLSTDIPAPGDYDGDGTEDQAIYRNGQWWINGSTSGVNVFGFGLATDRPVPTAARP